MIGPVRQPGLALAKDGTAGAVGWNTALGPVTSMMVTSMMTGPAREDPDFYAAGPPGGMLAGTVTPGQARRGLEQSVPERLVESVLAAAVADRAAGGRALRAVIGAHVAVAAPGTAAVAQGLIEGVLEAEPVPAAGPAVRSLLRAFQAGGLRMDAAGTALLAAFFSQCGYDRVTAPPLPSGLPFNLTEADQTGARLLARASGSWHPAAAYPKPAAARVRVCVVDDGFDITHPLVATKAVPAIHRDARRMDEGTPYAHPPESAALHGTAIVAIATGRTHVVEAVLLRHLPLDGVRLPMPFLIKRAAHEAMIINQSFTTYFDDPFVQDAMNDSRVAALQQASGTLLIQSAGNRLAEQTRDAAEANLAISDEPNVLTVGGYQWPDRLDPDGLVTDPARVHTLAPIDAVVPQVGADRGMIAVAGSSASGADVTNLAAMMLALAPHLPAPRLKGLIEAVSAKSPAWMAAGQKPSAHGMVDRDRALRLAAVAGLVVSGTADPVRTLTVAGGTRQGGTRQGGTRRGGTPRGRPGGDCAVLPGMTATQAADALKLGGAERAQALTDHAALCAG